MNEFTIDDHWDDWYENYKTNIDGFGGSAIYDYLHSGSRWRIHRGIRHLQLLESPSFEPTISYELFYQITIDDPLNNPTGTVSNYVIKTVWRTDIDLKVYAEMSVEERNSYKPTFEYKHVQVDKQICDDVFDKIKVNIPAWFYQGAESDYSGCDGTSYILKVGGAFLQAQYSWWSYYPDEWQPLVDAYNYAKTEFERCLSSSNRRTDEKKDN